MRKIESFQMKKIYAIGHALGITGNGSEDELHILVSGVTGKDSIKELSYQEAIRYCHNCDPGHPQESPLFTGRGSIIL